MGQKEEATAPLLFRFATLYGISPRTRFDLIVNQFVLEAWTKRELLIYQRGYSRSFVHVRDVIRGIIMGIEADLRKSFVARCLTSAAKKVITLKTKSCH